jgi:hypothetical protein
LVMLKLQIKTNKGLTPSQTAKLDWLTTIEK